MLEVGSVLDAAGVAARSPSPQAPRTLDIRDGQPTSTTSDLEVTARMPGAGRDKWQEAAHNAEVGCPVSRVLKAKVSMTATRNA